MKNKVIYGFSLIELVVCIAILATIVTWAIPKFDEILARNEMREVITTLNTNIHDAKYRAFLYHQRIVICGSKDGLSCNKNEWGQGILMFNDTTPNRLKDAGENIIQHIKLDLKYGTLDWRGFGVANHILFHPENGLPRGANGSFIYCSHRLNDHRKITLSKMGHTTIIHTSTC